MTQPPLPDDLVVVVARVVGLAILAGSLAGLLGIVHRFYARSRIPEGLAILVGLSGVALYLNTTSGLAEVLADDVDLLAPGSTLFHVATFGLAGVAAAVGGRVGDQVGDAVVTFSGDHGSDVDVSGLVTAVGRVITVDLPEEIGDVEAYDPVDPATKETLAGATLIFPRRLTVAELRDRLVARLKDDYGVGHVDVELDDDGTVTYLAVGARQAGLGPTLPPETRAVAIRADPARGATAGDVVQVFTTDPEPKRVATAEVRGTAGDIVTVAVDAGDVEKLDPAVRYRLVTLPVEPRADREFASLLRSVEETMSVSTIAEGASLVGQPVGSIDASVVAVRTADGSIDPIPSRDRQLAAGESVYAIARPDQLRRLDEAARTEPTTTKPVATEGD